MGRIIKDFFPFIVKCFEKGCRQFFQPPVWFHVQDLFYFLKIADCSNVMSIQYIMAAICAVTVFFRNFITIPEIVRPVDQIPFVGNVNQKPVVSCIFGKIFYNTAHDRVEFPECFPIFVY